MLRKGSESFFLLAHDANPTYWCLVIVTLKPTTDDSREVRETQKTCEMRQLCMGYFMLFMLLRQISHVSHLKPSRKRSSNYAGDKGIFLCDKG